MHHIPCELPFCIPPLTVGWYVVPRVRTTDGYKLVWIPEKNNCLVSTLLLSPPPLSPPSFSLLLFLLLLLLLVLMLIAPDNVRKKTAAAFAGFHPCNMDSFQSPFLSRCDHMSRSSKTFLTLLLSFLLVLLDRARNYTHWTGKRRREEETSPLIG